MPGQGRVQPLTPQSSSSLAEQRRRPPTQRPRRKVFDSSQWRTFNPNDSVNHLHDDGEFAPVARSPTPGATPLLDSWGASASQSGLEFASSQVSTTDPSLLSVIFSSTPPPPASVLDGGFPLTDHTSRDDAAICETDESPPLEDKEVAHKDVLLNALVEAVAELLAGQPCGVRELNLLEDIQVKQRGAPKQPQDFTAKETDLKAKNLLFKKSLVAEDSFRGNSGNTSTSPATTTTTATTGTSRRRVRRNRGAQSIASNDSAAEVALACKAHLLHEILAWRSQTGAMSDAGTHVDEALLKGNVAALATRDQASCRLVQRYLVEGPPAAKQMMINEAITQFRRLMADPIANYYCQTLVQFSCSGSQLVSLIDRISKILPQMSKNVYGTRVVQRIIARASSLYAAKDPHGGVCLDKIQLALRHHTKELAVDASGSHVVREMLNLLPENYAAFVHAEICNDALELSATRRGCCIVQRSMERGNDQQRANLVEALMPHVRTLMFDPFGNYVVQGIMNQCDEATLAEITELVLVDLPGLARHKFASNVVECCIRKATPFQLGAFTGALVALGSSHLTDLLLNSFGNYVVQNLLSAISSNGSSCSPVIRLVASSIPKLHESAHGRRIASAIANKFPKIATLQAGSVVGLSQAKATEENDATFSNEKSASQSNSSDQSFEPRSSSHVTACERGSSSTASSAIPRTGKIIREMPAFGGEAVAFLDPCYSSDSATPKQAGVQTGLDNRLDSGPDISASRTSSGEEIDDSPQMSDSWPEPLGGANSGTPDWLHPPYEYSPPLSSVGVRPPPDALPYPQNLSPAELVQAAYTRNEDPISSEELDPSSRRSGVTNGTDSIFGGSQSAPERLQRGGGFEVLLSCGQLPFYPPDISIEL